MVISRCVQKTCRHRSVKCKVVGKNPVTPATVAKCEIWHATICQTIVLPKTVCHVCLCVCKIIALPKIWRLIVLQKTTMVLWVATSVQKTTHIKNLLLLCKADVTQYVLCDMSGKQKSNGLSVAFCFVKKVIILLFLLLARLGQFLLRCCDSQS